MIKTNFLWIIVLLAFVSPSNIFAENKSESIRQKTINAYRAQGLDAQRKGDSAKALEFFTKAISLGLEDAAVYNDLGVLYEQLGLLNKAEQHYIDALQLDSSYLPPYMNLAYLYLGQRQISLAADLFLQRYELGNSSDPWTEKAKEELLKIRPDYAQRILAKAAQKMQSDLIIQAREDLNAKIEASKKHYQQGMDLYGVGNFQEAIKEYDYSLSLNPHNRQVIDARKQAVIGLAKKNIQDRSNEAILLLEKGDAASAKHEIEKALTTIP